MATTRRNIYKHAMELKQLKIKNAERNEFAKKLEEVPYRGYDVENITDGRKIVIVKPGENRHGGKCEKKIFLFLFIIHQNKVFGK